MALVSFTTYEVHLIHEHAPKASPHACAGSTYIQLEDQQHVVPGCAPPAHKIGRSQGAEESGAGFMATWR